ncbi:MAG: hypothetical protein ACHQT8_00345 [Chlamydiales bacterium]
MVLSISQAQALRMGFYPRKNGTFGTIGFVARLTAFRNHPVPMRVPARPNCGRRPSITPPPRDSVTIVGRRLIAAFGYPALALVATIEAVVRAALALIALIPSVGWAFYADGRPLQLVAMNGGVGFIVGLETIVRCGVGWVKNFYSDQLTYESLALCEPCGSDDD